PLRDRRLVGDAEALPALRDPRADRALRLRRRLAPRRCRRARRPGGVARARLADAPAPGPRLRDVPRRRLVAPRQPELVARRGDLRRRLGPLLRALRRRLAGVEAAARARDLGCARRRGARARAAVGAAPGDALGARAARAPRRPRARRQPRELAAPDGCGAALLPPRALGRAAAPVPLRARALRLSGAQPAASSMRTPST